MARVDSITRSNKEVKEQGFGCKYFRNAAVDRTAD